jgi:hypothetical protein
MVKNIFDTAPSDGHFVLKLEGELPGRWVQESLLPEVVPTAITPHLQDRSGPTRS